MSRSTNSGSGGGGASLSNLGWLEDHETDGRYVVMLGLRYSRVLKRREAFTLQYYADLIPVALETDAIVEGEGAGAPLERSTVYGAGISPLGLRLVFRPSARVRPFLGASGGFMLFSDEVPLPGARQFTFTADIETGIEIPLTNGHGLMAGVRFHHLSNANTGDVNPGLNAFAFFAGFSVSR